MRGNVRGERFESSEVLEQLPEADLDAKSARQRNRRLRKEKRVKAELEQAGCAGRAAQIDSGEIGEDAFEQFEPVRLRLGCGGRCFERRRSYLSRLRWRRWSGPRKRFRLRLDRRLVIRRGGGERKRNARGKIGKVTLALEGISGEGDAAARVAGMNGGPIHRHACEPETGQGRGDRILFARVFRNRMDEVVMRLFRPVLPRELRERLSRARLEERVAGMLQQRARRVCKAHGRAQMIRPILRVGRLLGGEPLAGDTRENRDRRRVKRDAAHRFRERCDDRIDHRRVEGVRSREPPRRDCPLVKLAFERLDGVERSREHAELGRIDRGNRDPAIREEFRRFRFSQPRGEHRARRQFLRPSARVWPRGAGRLRARKRRPWSPP